MWHLHAFWRLILRSSFYQRQFSGRSESSHGWWHRWLARFNSPRSIRGYCSKAYKKRLSSSPLLAPSCKSYEKTWFFEQACILQRLGKGKTQWLQSHGRWNQGHRGLDDIWYWTERINILRSQGGEADHGDYNRNRQLFQDSCGSRQVGNKKNHSQDSVQALRTFQRFDVWARRDSTWVW